VSVLTFHSLTGLAKSCVKADLLIYGNIFTASGQGLSVAIKLSNKMDFNFCSCMDGFPKFSHNLKLVIQAKYI